MWKWDAEGANLEQAKPDETLRQKDPVPNHSGKSQLRHRRCKSHDRDNLSGPITEARDPIRAPLAFNNRPSTLESDSSLALWVLSEIPLQIYFQRRHEPMNAPANLNYAKSDEWFDADSGKVGITDYAQSQLSDIVFVEILVDEGETIDAGKAIASVESVKASAEIYSPASGKVSAVNKDLPNKAEAIDGDPYGAAWLIQLEGASAGDVMDSASYEKYCEERSQ
jgi:glycine cleavage system H protein